MKPETLQAIRVLRDKIRVLEEETLVWKKAINRLYTDENESAPYLDVGDSSRSLGNLRTDQFYGHTLAEAAQEYLERRKAGGLGSASINDIYKALKDGGYKFETAKEEYAKNGVRISLRKNPGTFHQLPNGDYGLCEWYGVKGDDEEKHRKRPTKRKVVKAENNSRQDHSIPPAAGAGAPVTAEQFANLVRKKHIRLNKAAKLLGTEEAALKLLLGAPSGVYIEDRGWLRYRAKPTMPTEKDLAGTTAR